MINLFKPYMPDNLTEINDILYSGSLAYGKWGRLFERSIQEYIGCKEEPLVVNSFTGAIQIVLATLGIRSDDEIIASPQSCLASTMPLKSFGAKVVWADIDPSRGTLSPDSVKSKITSRTKLIFHNHHCSYPGYIDEINQLGKDFGITVVDDCIEAFGSEYKGNIMGNIGTDVSIFSFQTVRLPNAIDGACIIFKDRAMYEKAYCVRDFGIDRKTFRDSIGEINPASDISMHGYGFTLNEINSYIGNSQMQHISMLFSQQRSNASHWEHTLEEKYPQLIPLDTKESNPSYWVFGCLSDDKNKMITCFRDSGYYASSVHLPNTYYSVFGAQGVFPGVDQFYNQFVALPSGWWATIK